MSALEELFEVLRAMSEQESYEVLRHTRASVNPEAILNQVRDGNLLMQLSLVPERRRRYEFPYLHEMPTFLLQPEIRTLTHSLMITRLGLMLLCRIDNARHIMILVHIKICIGTPTMQQKSWTQG